MNPNNVINSAQFFKAMYPPVETTFMNVLQYILQSCKHFLYYLDFYKADNFCAIFPPFHSLQKKMIRKEQELHFYASLFT